MAAGREGGTISKSTPESMEVVRSSPAEIAEGGRNRRQGEGKVHCEEERERSRNVKCGC